MSKDICFPYHAVPELLYKALELLASVEQDDGVEEAAQAFRAIVDEWVER